jgi:2-iminoacetate synthase
MLMATDSTVSLGASAAAIARNSSCKRSIGLFVPLYLSSFCVNYCTYCSFRFPNRVKRKHLKIEEVLAQAAILGERGFRHVLLVAADFPKMTSTEYFVSIIHALVDRGFTISVEIAAQSTTAYQQLVDAGTTGVTLYQETYQRASYARNHPLGPKVWYDYRLEAPERAAEAGMSRLGLGVLLGLADPNEDVRALIRHGRYLQNRFPNVHLTFGLPRIHDAPKNFQPAFQVEDELLIRLYCVLRLAFPKAGLVLSTRESPELRDLLARTCITQMSAGSSTAPGGYGVESSAEVNGQFPVRDNRSLAEVAAMLRVIGADIRWRPPCDF